MRSSRKRQSTTIQKTRRRLGRPTRHAMPHGYKSPRLYLDQARDEGKQAKTSVRVFARGPAENQWGGTRGEEREDAATSPPGEQ